MLLIEASTGSRAVLQRMLTAQGFNVTGVADAQQAHAATEQQCFGYAVVALGLRDGKVLDVVRQLRRRLAALRIVIVSDVDSFASAIVALRAGADDYLPKSVGPAELTDALLDRSPELPPVPTMPLGLSRTCWEHIVRIYEQCGRNVSATAQRLGMHRRSLQRVLSKRAPQPRADQTECSCWRRRLSTSCGASMRAVGGAMLVPRTFKSRAPDPRVSLPRPATSGG